MIEHDVDIINMSMHWSWSGPGDGTSPYSNSPLKSVDTAVTGGVNLGSIPQVTRLWTLGSVNSATRMVMISTTSLAATTAMPLRLKRTTCTSKPTSAGMIYGRVSSEDLDLELF